MNKTTNKKHWSIQQVETALYILTELKSIAEQEDEYLEELEMAIPLFGSLLVSPIMIFRFSISLRGLWN